MILPWLLLLLLVGGGGGSTPFVKPLETKAACEIVLAALHASRIFLVKQCQSEPFATESFAESVHGSCLSLDHGRGLVLVRLEGSPTPVFTRGDTCGDEQFVVIGTKDSPDRPQSQDCLELILRREAGAIKYQMRVVALPNPTAPGKPGAVAMCGEDEGKIVIDAGRWSAARRVTPTKLIGSCPKNWRAAPDAGKVGK